MIKDPKDVLAEIGIEVDPVLDVCLGETRDIKTVLAYQHRRSGVIYLNKDVGYDYSGNESSVTWMIEHDDKRRAQQFGRLFYAKKGLDFGCGYGGFAQNVLCFGIDPCVPAWVEPSNRLQRTMDDVANVSKGKFDIVTAFHVLEHLSDPIAELRKLKRHMADGATLIVEVPHARDWLLLNCEAFKRFTLWSQHLILHTRESLRTLLGHAGFTVDRIEGFQRYPHSNHIHWLTNGEPGCFEANESLDREYSSQLARVDQTDTLIAYCQKKT